MGRSGSVQNGSGLVSSSSAPPRDIKKMSTPLPLLPSRRAMLEEQQASQATENSDGNNNVIWKFENMDVVDLIEDSDNSMTTVKKGPLWQQQNFVKLHQRIFNRWKKRYFILTIDYLVCFSKSASKVGRSEMGKFIYKIPLSDVIKTEWLRPKKSDKGAIILDIKGNFGLSLWSKHGLSDWMEALNETCQISKIRRPKQACSSAIINHIQLGSGQLSNNDPNENTQPLIDGDNIGSETKCNSASPEQSFEFLKIQSSGNNYAPNSSKSRSHETGNTVSSNEAAKKYSPLSRMIDNIVEEEKDSFVPKSSLSTQDNVSVKREPAQLAGRNMPSMKKSELDNKENLADRNVDHLSGNSKRPEHPSVSKGQAADGIGSTDGGSETSPDGETISLKSPMQLIRMKHNMTEDAGQQQQNQHFRQTNNLTAKPERPNLIRRDDSWQSLVSLTCAGRNSMQVAQKQPPTQQTTSASITVRDKRLDLKPIVNSELKSNNLSHLERRRLIDIESTVTPLRGPASLLRRQQSVQSRNFVGQNYWQHANSFDVAPTDFGQMNSGSIQSNEMTSYHHKLMQLQMLHNSNNVDYVRQNNDYQIYGPESIATNHYGYYSMRSNLKSAASEFSFIRPNSSGLQQENQNHLIHKSRLPHQFSSYMLNIRDTNLQQHAILGTQNNRMSLAMAPSDDRVLDVQARDHNDNSMNLFYSGSNVPGHQITLAELAAPQRELPLKPNKKRANTALEQTKKSQTSISSNIACFFRRAFFRRSTSKRRSKKLTESCSSSLGAFDESCFPNVPLIQSAFSTGSKSVNQQQSGAAIPSQRMIDMIEAFANKTVLDQNYRPQNALGLTGAENFSRQHSQNFYNDSSQQLASRLSSDNQQPLVPPLTNDARKAVNRWQQQQQQLSRNNQFGSLLNKSSSISTTMALANFSGGEGSLRRVPNGASVMRENITSHRGANNPIVSQIESDSPLATRSNRVMSANLTPLFQGANLRSTADGLQSGLSPRGTGRARDPLPRPSSIYGQPSMISSSVTSSRVDRLANFGQHRSSMHAGRVLSSIYADFHRRPNVIKGPFLGTTREVCEEVSTPTMDDIEFAKSARLMQNSTPLYQRQALVNPILHSSTMDTIYDNHPLVQRNDSTVIESSRGVAYSHYDNQHLSNIPINDRAEQPYTPSRFADENPFQSTRSIEQSGQHFLVEQPPRPSSNRSANDRTHNAQQDSRMMLYNKPAAIVAPRTPSHNMLANCTPTRDMPTQALFIDRAQEARGGGLAQHIQRVGNNIAASVSPKTSRRAIHSQLSLSTSQHSYYQYSPLVDRQTRLLKRNDGTQATVIAPNSTSDYTQSMIDGQRSIKISSESSATIDVPDSSSSGINEITSGTFLISSRPSKNSDDSKNSSNNDRTLHSRDGYTSTSRDDNSSSGRTASEISLSGFDLKTHSHKSGVDKRRRSKQARSENKIGEQNVRRSNNGGNLSSQSSDNSGRRSSSIEQSDELTSRNDSIDKPDETKWINSKLVH